MGAPCAWSVEPGQVCAAWSGYSPSQQEVALSIAIGFMWAATGRRYGQCPVTVQPSRPVLRAPAYRTYPVAEVSGLGGFSPYIHNGQWFNAGTGLCGCTDAGACELPLPGPTSKAAVTAVRIDGAVVPATAYVVMDAYRLVRTDGDCWPTCVDYTQQDPPEFEIEYLRGLPVPADVASATGVLACEVAANLSGGACRAPAGVSRITRQGVEIDVAEVAAPAAGGPMLTGLREVDMVIQAHNPAGRVQRSRIYSPDLPTARVVT